MKNNLQQSKSPLTQVYFEKFRNTPAYTYKFPTVKKTYIFTVTRLESYDENQSVHISLSKFNLKKIFKILII